MFEGWASDILATYLGQFLEVQREQLRVSLWRAWSTGLTLENIAIRPTALDHLQLPFKLHHGSIGRVTTQVPWKALRSPLIIELSDIEICLQLLGPEDLTHAAAAAREFVAKQALILAEELRHAEKENQPPYDNSNTTTETDHDNDNDTSNELPARKTQHRSLLQSLAQHAITMLIRRLQLTISNIRIHIIDPRTDRSFGVLIDQLHTCLPGEGQHPSQLLAEDAGLRERSFIIAAGSIQKQCAIDGLRVYWNVGKKKIDTHAKEHNERNADTNAQPYSQERSSRNDGRASRSIAADADNTVIHTDNSILLPTNIVVHLSSSGTHSRHSITIHAASVIHHVPLQIASDQTQDILSFLDDMEWLTRRAKHAHLRSDVVNSEQDSIRSRAMWQFAVTAVLNDLRGPLRATPAYKSAVEIQHERRRYVLLYGKKLQVENKGDRPRSLTVEGQAPTHSSSNSVSSTVEDAGVPPALAGQTPGEALSACDSQDDAAASKHTFGFHPVGVEQIAELERALSVTDIIMCRSAAQHSMDHILSMQQQQQKHRHRRPKSAPVFSEAHSDDATDDATSDKEESSSFSSVGQQSLMSHSRSNSKGEQSQQKKKRRKTHGDADYYSNTKSNMDNNNDDDFYESDDEQSALRTSKAGISWAIARAAAFLGYVPRSADEQERNNLPQPSLAEVEELYNAVDFHPEDMDEDSTTNIEEFNADYNAVDFHPEDMDEDSTTNIEEFNADTDDHAVVKVGKNVERRRRNSSTSTSSSSTSSTPVVSSGEGSKDDAVQQKSFIEMIMSFGICINRITLDVIDPESKRKHVTLELNGLKTQIQQENDTSDKSIGKGIGGVHDREMLMPSTSTSRDATHSINTAATAVGTSAAHTKRRGTVVDVTLSTIKAYDHTMRIDVDALQQQRSTSSLLILHPTHNASEKCHAAVQGTSNFEDGYPSPYVTTSVSSSSSVAAAEARVLPSSSPQSASNEAPSERQNSTHQEGTTTQHSASSSPVVLRLRFISLTSTLNVLIEALQCHALPSTLQAIASCIPKPVAGSFASTYMHSVNCLSVEARSSIKASKLKQLGAPLDIVCKVTGVEVFFGTPSKRSNHPNEHVTEDAAAEREARRYQSQSRATGIAVLHLGTMVLHSVGQHDAAVQSARTYAVLEQYRNVGNAKDVPHDDSRVAGESVQNGTYSREEMIAAIATLESRLVYNHFDFSIDDIQFVCSYTSPQDQYSLSEGDGAGEIQSSGIEIQASEMDESDSTLIGYTSSVFHCHSQHRHHHLVLQPLSLSGSLDLHKLSEDYDKPQVRCSLDFGAMSVSIPTTTMGVLHDALVQSTYVGLVRNDYQDGAASGVADGYSAETIASSARTVHHHNSSLTSLGPLHTMVYVRFSRTQIDMVDDYKYDTYDNNNDELTLLPRQQYQLSFTSCSANIKAYEAGPSIALDMSSLSVDDVSSPEELQETVIGPPVLRGRETIEEASCMTKSNFLAGIPRFVKVLNVEEVHVNVTPVIIVGEGIPAKDVSIDVLDINANGYEGEAGNYITRVHEDRPSSISVSIINSIEAMHKTAVSMNNTSIGHTTIMRLFAFFAHKSDNNNHKGGDDTAVNEERQLVEDSNTSLPATAPRDESPVQYNEQRQHSIVIIDINECKLTWKFEELAAMQCTIPATMHDFLLVYKDIASIDIPRLHFQIPLLDVPEEPAIGGHIADPEGISSDAAPSSIEGVDTYPPSSAVAKDVLVAERMTLNVATLGYSGYPTLPALHIEHITATTTTTTTTTTPTPTTTIMLLQSDSNDRDRQQQQQQQQQQRLVCCVPSMDIGLHPSHLTLLEAAGQLFHQEYNALANSHRRHEMSRKSTPQGEGIVASSSASPLHQKAFGSQPVAPTSADEEDRVSVAPPTAPQPTTTAATSSSVPSLNIAVNVDAIGISILGSMPSSTCLKLQAHAIRAAVNSNSMLPNDLAIRHHVSPSSKVALGTVSWSGIELYVLQPKVAMDMMDGFPPSLYTADLGVPPHDPVHLATNTWADNAKEDVPRRIATTGALARPSMRRQLHVGLGLAAEAPLLAHGSMAPSAGCTDEDAMASHRNPNPSIANPVSTSEFSSPTQQPYMLSRFSASSVMSRYYSAADSEFDDAISSLPDGVRSPMEGKSPQKPSVIPLDPCSGGYDAQMVLAVLPSKESGPDERQAEAARIDVEQEEELVENEHRRCCCCVNVVAYDDDKFGAFMNGNAEYDGDDIDVDILKRHPTRCTVVNVSGVASRVYMYGWQHAIECIETYFIFSKRALNLMHATNKRWRRVGRKGESDADFAGTTDDVDASRDDEEEPGHAVHAVTPEVAMRQRYSFSPVPGGSMRLSTTPPSNPADANFLSTQRYREDGDVSDSGAPYARGESPPLEEHRRGGIGNHLHARDKSPHMRLMKLSVDSLVIEAIAAAGRQLQQDEEGGRPVPVCSVIVSFIAEKKAYGGDTHLGAEELLQQAINAAGGTATKDAVSLDIDVASVLLRVGAVHAADAMHALCLTQDNAILGIHAVQATLFGHTVDAKGKNVSLWLGPQTVMCASSFAQHAMHAVDEIKPAVSSLMANSSGITTLPPSPQGADVAIDKRHKTMAPTTALAASPSTHHHNHNNKIISSAALSHKGATAAASNSGRNTMKLTSSLDRIAILLLTPAPAPAQGSIPAFQLCASDINAVAIECCTSHGTSLDHITGSVSVSLHVDAYNVKNLDWDSFIDPWEGTVQVCIPTKGGAASPRPAAQDGHDSHALSHQGMNCPPFLHAKHLAVRLLSQQGLECSITRAVAEAASGSMALIEEMSSVAREPDTLWESLQRNGVASNSAGNLRSTGQYDGRPALYRIKNLTGNTLQAWLVDPLMPSSSTRDKSLRMAPSSPALDIPAISGDGDGVFEVPLVPHQREADTLSEYYTSKAGKPSVLHGVETCTNTSLAAHHPQQDPQKNEGRCTAIFFRVAASVGDRDVDHHKKESVLEKDTNDNDTASTIAGPLHLDRTHTSWYGMHVPSPLLSKGSTSRTLKVFASTQESLHGAFITTLHSGMCVANTTGIDFEVQLRCDADALHSDDPAADRLLSSLPAGVTAWVPLLFAQRGCSFCIRPCQARHSPHTGDDGDGGSGMYSWSSPITIHDIVQGTVCSTMQYIECHPEGSSHPTYESNVLVSIGAFRSEATHHIVLAPPLTLHNVLPVPVEVTITLQTLLASSCHQNAIDHDPTIHATTASTGAADVTHVATADTANTTTAVTVFLQPTEKRTLMHVNAAQVESLMLRPEGYEVTRPLIPACIHIPSISHSKMCNTDAQNLGDEFFVARDSQTASSLNKAFVDKSASFSASIAGDAIVTAETTNNKGATAAASTLVTPAFDVWLSADTPTTLHELPPGKSTVDISLYHSINTVTGSHIYRFTCPVWVYNCTGLPISIRNTAGVHGVSTIHHDALALSSLAGIEDQFTAWGGIEEEDDTVPVSWIPPLMLLAEHTAGDGGSKEGHRPWQGSLASPSGAAGTVSMPAPPGTALHAGALRGPFDNPDMVSATATSAMQNEHQQRRRHEHSSLPPLPPLSAVKDPAAGAPMVSVRSTAALSTARSAAGSMLSVGRSASVADVPGLSEILDGGGDHLRASPTRSVRSMIGMQHPASRARGIAESMETSLTFERPSQWPSMANILSLPDLMPQGNTTAADDISPAVLGSNSITGDANAPGIDRTHPDSVASAHRHRRQYPQRLRLQLRLASTKAPPGRTYWSSSMEIDPFGGMALVGVPSPGLALPLPTPGSAVGGTVQQGSGASSATRGISLRTPPPMPPSSSSSSSSAAAALFHHRCIFPIVVTASLVPGGDGALALSIVPRYVLRNMLEWPLQYKQQQRSAGGGGESELPPGAMRAVVWSNATLPPRLCVRVQEAGWLWSGGFSLDVPGDIFVKIRHRDRGITMLVRVDITVENGVTHVVVSHNPSGFAPYRVENCSLETLHARQKGVREQQDVLRPYCSLNYAWDEPTLPHSLVLELPGSRPLGVFNLDKVGQDLLVQVHKGRLSTDQDTRLRILVRAEGPTRVLTVIDEHRHIALASLERTDDVNEEESENETQDVGVLGRALKQHIASLRPEHRSLLNTSSLSSSSSSSSSPSSYRARSSASLPSLLWELSLDLSWIGVSLLGPTHELAYFRLSNAEARVAASAARYSTSVEIGHIQLDNSSPWAAFPVTLVLPAPSSTLTSSVAAAVELTRSPALKAHVSLWRRRPAGVLCVEVAEVQMKSLGLYIDQQYVQEMIAAVRSMMSIARGKRAVHVAVPDAVLGVASIDSKENNAVVQQGRGHRTATETAQPPSPVQDLASFEAPFLVPPPNPKPYHAALYLQQHQHSHHQKIYMDLLSISHMEITLSFLSSPIHHSAISHPRLAALQRLLSLADVEDARLWLAGLDLANPLMDTSALTQVLRWHYIRAGTPEIFKVVGAANVFGDPVAFLHHLGLGVWAFVSAPAAGLVESARQRGPRQFLLGVLYGTRGLLQNLVFAVSNAATKASGAARKAIVVWGFDTQEDGQPLGAGSFRRRVMWTDSTVPPPPPPSTSQSPSHLHPASDLHHHQLIAYNDAESNNNGLLAALFRGVVGLISEPIKGAELEGFAGLFKGLRRGALGAVALPLASFLEMSARTADSIRRAVAGSSNLGWMRPPRPVSHQDRLAPYDWSEAMGRWLLNEVERADAKHAAWKGRVEGEVFLLCVPAANYTGGQGGSTAMGGDKDDKDVDGIHEEQHFSENHSSRHRQFRNPLSQQHRHHRASAVRDSGCYLIATTRRILFMKAKGLMWQPAVIWQAMIEDVELISLDSLQRDVIRFVANPMPKSVFNAPSSMIREQPYDSVRVAKSRLLGGRGIVSSRDVFSFLSVECEDAASADRMRRAACDAMDAVSKRVLMVGYGLCVTSCR